MRKIDLIYDNFYNLPGKTTSGFDYNDDNFDSAEKEFESLAGLAEQSKESWIHDVQMKLLSVCNFSEHEYSVFLMFEENYCMMDVFIKNMSLSNVGTLMILNGIRGKQVDRITAKNSLPVIVHETDNGYLDIKYIRSILQNNKAIRNVVLNYSDMSKEYYTVFRDLALTCKIYNRKLIVECIENKKIIKKRLAIFEPRVFIGNSELFEKTGLKIGFAIVKKDYPMRISDKELVTTYDFIDDTMSVNAFELFTCTVEKIEKIKSLINAIDVYKSKEFLFVYTGNFQF